MGGAAVDAVLGPKIHSPGAKAETVLTNSVSTVCLRMGDGERAKGDSDKPEMPKAKGNVSKIGRYFQSLVHG